MIAISKSALSTSASYHLNPQLLASLCMQTDERLSASAYLLTLPSPRVLPRGVDLLSIGVSSKGVWDGSPPRGPGVKEPFVMGILGEVPRNRDMSFLERRFCSDFVKLPVKNGIEHTVDI